MEDMGTPGYAYGGISGVRDPDIRDVACALEGFRHSVPMGGDPESGSSPDADTI